MQRYHVISTCLGILAITSWLSSGCSDATNCENLGKLCLNGSTTTANSNGGGGSGASSASGMSTTSSSSGDGGSGGNSTQMCPTGYVCVPEGTTDHFVRLPNDNENCDGDWTEEVDYAPPTQPGCTQCTCGTPQGGGCSLDLQTFDTVDVMNNICSNPSPTSTITSLQCFDSSDVDDGFAVSEPPPQQGSCTPGNSDPVELTPTMACSTQGAAVLPDISCGDEMVCVPEGNGELCNVVSASEDCATGYEVKPGEVATVGEDTRECECDCGAPVNPTCNASATLHENNGCNGSGQTAPISLPSACVQLSTTFDRIRLDPGTWSAEACQVIDNSSGEVTFGPAEKLCCLTQNGGTSP